MAHAIWYAAENDFVQRKMLRNSLKYASHLTPQQKEDIEWILLKIEKPFRHNRNAAIHAPLMFTTGVTGGSVTTWLQALISSESPRARELLAISDLKAEFEHYGMVAERLADLVRLMIRAIRLPALQPWPEKPDLQRKPHKSKDRQSRSNRKSPRARLSHSGA